MVNVEVPDKKEGLAIGTNIAIKIGAETIYKKITNRDTIFYRDAHSALATATTESYAEVTNLDPPGSQLYQIHTVLIDGNVEVQLKQPAATNRWGTQRSPTGGYLLDKYSSLGAGEPINLWILEDYPPNVQLYNNTGVSIAATLWWIGWRYDVLEIAREINGRIKTGTRPATFMEVAIGPPGQ